MGKDGSFLPKTDTTNFVDDAYAKFASLKQAFPSKFDLEHEDEAIEHTMYGGEIPECPVGYGLAVRKGDIYGVHGASINVLPYSLYESLTLGDLLPTNVVIQLADRSTSIPRGVVEDVLVVVDKLAFPVDFYVIDMEHDKHSTLILLGRPFLKRAKTKIDSDTGSFTVKFDGKIIEFNMYDAMRYLNIEDQFLCSIDVFEPCVQGVFDVLRDDDLQSLLDFSLIADSLVFCLPNNVLEIVVELNELSKLPLNPSNYKPMPLHVHSTRPLGRAQSSNELEAHEEPVASEVIIDTMGLNGLNREQKVTWRNLSKSKRVVQCTKFIDTNFLAQLGLFDGFWEMMGRVRLLGMLDYAPRTYKRCVYEFMSTLTLVKHRGDTRVRFRIHDRVCDISLSQVREAFGLVAPSSDNPFVPMGVPSEDVGTFWYCIYGLLLSSGGEKISSILHPALRMAVYFVGMTIFCKGETGKLNQVEMCYLRALLLGSVGIPDWADLWLKSCIDVRTKLGGHLIMGGMITHLITRLGYAPNNACDPVSDKFLLFKARTLLKMNM
ncbi:hypothetical protein BVRB_7g179420 [Beta vulgaris subsp. vulgaris]|uniref:Arabidopsis retrotransposon Orf1 C-terminal domain-containing protein n=1 Tax=Beta vulgaris subsp. vulgaris TaxID=3555 RepID=A0A0J8B7R5_BETVV|nr:hypothetical protein BVRB_7g179420 [Beta vulgaris subsp. vulgaris]